MIEKEFNEGKILDLADIFIDVLKKHGNIDIAVRDKDGKYGTPLSVYVAKMSNGKKALVIEDRPISEVKKQFEEKQCK